MNRKHVFTLLAAVVVASLGATAASRPAKKVPVVDRAAQLKRGEYLVTIGGCHDCHTPWITQPDGSFGPDMSRALSGHPQQFPITQQNQFTSDRWGYAGAATNTAFSGAWGVSFAANLSPDVETGTGIWTFDIFRNTIRRGKHWGVARPLLPPMPWFNYRHMTDDDLLAVFTYIHSLKPIRNEVPSPLPPAQKGTSS